jgi:hypothetical protein
MNAAFPSSDQGLELGLKKFAATVGSRSTAHRPPLRASDHSVSVPSGLALKTLPFPRGEVDYQNLYVVCGAVLFSPRCRAILDSGRRNGEVTDSLITTPSELADSEHETKKVEFELRRLGTATRNGGTGKRIRFMSQSSGLRGGTCVSTSQTFGQM